MPILSGDVKLLKSAVMTDVPEGGGAPTGNEITDGVSNAIFPDISELDRAGGRVSLRKTFAAVHTDDTDTYFGANVIVAEPPQDPRVSVTLFTNGLTFDTRAEAQARVEAYLNKGPEWSGYLYENHIAGQRAVQFFQRTTDQIPNVGQTLVLIENEGLETQKEQYIRATSVSVVERTFTYSSGGAPTDYKANIVTLEISDALRTDFTGSPSSRFFKRTTDGSTESKTNTKVRDTIVADAGTYVGVVPLTEAASLGDFSVSGSSIFTQLVPSAQTETPISDLRSNGISAALTPTGAALTQTLTMAFSTTQAMHVGGPIYPGSLSITRAGVTATDSGGLLVSGGSEVGSVDYENGVATLATDLFGTSAGSHTVVFTPAAIPDLVSDQSAIQVTPETRAQSYAFTLGSLPLARTTSISYLAQGRWYVLRDNGAGVLKASDASYGAGTINYTTGSIVVTLGALPDVGSSVVVSSYSEITAVRSSNTSLLNAGKVYVPINTSAQVSEEKGAKTIEIGGVTIAWTDGTAKTATDDGLGNISGDATGTVDYANGVIRLSPNTLPAAGTVFVVDITAATPLTANNVPLVNGNIGATNIIPGSVSITVQTTHAFAWAAWSIYASGTTNFVGPSSLYDRDGKLYLFVGSTELEVGTINYATGAINVTGRSVDPAIFGDTGVVISASAASGYATTYHNAFLSYPGSKSASISFAANANVRYSTTLPSADSISVTVSQYVARTVMVPNYTLRGVSFTLGSKTYVQLTDGTLVYDSSPTAGGGTPGGNVSGALGAAFLSYWPVGASSTIQNWRGLIAPPTVGTEAPFTAFQSIFRTASSPIRPGSISVLGTMQDGTTFNVTATADGKINGTRVKGRVNYEFGLVELFFVNPSGDTNLNVDLSFLGISGVGTIPADLAQLNSLRYNAVAYSYLPLDAELLGLDPVRLPSDGRVPIFRPGGFAVVGHTGELTATVSNGQTLNCGRVRLSRVRVVGADGVVINTGYSADLDAGTVTFSNVTGYSQPVTVQHRIEDMAVVRETDINGTVRFTRPLTHAYPLGSYLSSALVAGDLFARVSTLFDQQTWDGTWKDSIDGSAATATFNNTAAPITVTNRGALTERWAVRFTNTTSFDVIGENVGVIAIGNTGADCAPLNPITGSPYFTIPALGWGGGWSIGNVLRFNTVGAEFPIWVVRTVQQGPETVPNDQFSLLIRGDVNA